MSSRPMAFKSPGAVPKRTVRKRLRTLCQIEMVLALIHHRQYRERGDFVPVVVEPDRMLLSPPDVGSGGMPAAAGWRSRCRTCPG